MSPTLSDKSIESRDYSLESRDKSIEGESLNTEIKPPLSPSKEKKAKEKVFADPNEVFFPYDDRLDETFREYVKMRAAIKKPLTDFAKKCEMNKLMKMANNDNDVAIEILSQSITHNWQGLYELKQNKSSEKPYMKNGMIDWDKV